MRRMLRQRRLGRQLTSYLPASGKLLLQHLQLMLVRVLVPIVRAAVTRPLDLAGVCWPVAAVVQQHQPLTSATVATAALPLCRTTCLMATVAALRLAPRLPSELGGQTMMMMLCTSTSSFWKAAPDDRAQLRKHMHSCRQSVCHQQRLLR